MPLYLNEDEKGKKEKVHTILGFPVLVLAIFLIMVEVISVLENKYEFRLG